MSKLKHLGEVGGAFLKLGLISFGGPVAHFGYFREEFVQKRRWLDDEAYGDLMALCQFLPGPASSQMVFALGMRRAGLAGALLAAAGFILPSAAIMVLFGYGFSALGELHHAGWLHGLKLAAVAVVAQAVWGMGIRLCPDRGRLTLALAVAAGILIVPSAFSQIAAIAIGALVGWWRYREAAAPPSASAGLISRQHFWAAAALVTAVLLLVLLPVLAAATELKSIAVFDRFYRAGSLVFGGGHVILPLLRAEVVPAGWVSDQAFLAGYGLAQAVPGPLFSFTAYLGAVMHPGTLAWASGLWCLFAIYLPAYLLIGGALPFWSLFRSRTWAQAALRGANAAVVGVLLAAFYNPVWTVGITGARSVALAAAAFAALQFWKAPPWVVVIGAAALGQVFL